MVKAIELGESTFGGAPKSFNSIDVVRPVGELTFSVLDPEVLFVTHIDEAVVPAPAVTVDDRLEPHTTPDHLLQRCFSAIRNDLGIDVLTTLKDTKYDRLASSSSSLLPSNSLRSKITLVHFNDA